MSGHITLRISGASTCHDPCMRWLCTANILSRLAPKRPVVYPAHWLDSLSDNHKTMPFVERSVVGRSRLQIARFRPCICSLYHGSQQRASQSLVRCLRIDSNRCQIPVLFRLSPIQGR